MQNITTPEELKALNPELYSKIYGIGFRDGYNNGYNNHEDYIDYENNCIEECEDTEYEYEESIFDNYQDEKAIALDGSNRYYIHIYADAAIKLITDLVDKEYTTTQDYKNFIRLINLKSTKLFVVFNPTHKVFAVETNITVIDEYYPHLVDAEKLDLNTIYKKYI
jgi:hypothetical protein